MTPATGTPTRLPRPADGLPVVAVVGAGFGGLEFCKRFRGEAHVILVDRQNHHLFQPLLYQVAMAGLSAPDVAAPIRHVLSGIRRVRTHMGEVRTIDLDARELHADGVVIEWDWLVLAPGGVTSYFGNDGWDEHALGLKTLEDALRIRSHILTSFERAENELDEAERRRLMTIVVVGGGPTGVELAGAMAELAHRVFRRDFRRIDPTAARVILIEALDEILAAFPPGLSESARRQLEDLGVEVRLKCMVRDVRGDGVTIEGPGGEEAIETRNVLWAAGIAGNPLLRSLAGVDLDRGGRVPVLPDLSIPGHPSAFAIGDAATVADDGEEVPGLAPAAMQMGRHVARLIRSELRDGPRAPDERPSFSYTDRGMMATIGRSRAIAWSGPIKASGFFAWIFWLFVHLMTLVGFRNRLVVFVEWMWQYITYQRGARIITTPVDR